MTKSVSCCFPCWRLSLLGWRPVLLGRGLFPEFFHLLNAARTCLWMAQRAFALTLQRLFHCCAPGQRTAFDPEGLGISIGNVGKMMLDPLHLGSSSSSSSCISTTIRNGLCHPSHSSAYRKKHSWQDFCGEHRSDVLNTLASAERK